MTEGGYETNEARQFVRPLDHLLLHALDFFANFVVISQETNFQAVIQVQEEKPKIAISAALKEDPPQFPNADATVNVRLPEGFD